MTPMAEGRMNVSPAVSDRPIRDRRGARPAPGSVTGVGLGRAPFVSEGDFQ